MKLILGLLLFLGACGGVAPPDPAPASASQAVCTPTCDRYSCNLDDGCGGICGCPTGQICFPDNVCGHRCQPGWRYCGDGMCWRGFCP